MSNFRISSWNIQGGSGTNPKYSALLNAADAYQSGIVLLQEAGSPGTTGLQEGGVYGNYTCLIMRTDPTAKVERCSTGILVHNSLVSQVQAGDFRDDYNRPIPFVIYKNHIITTIHAIADDSQSVAQVKAVLSRLNGEANPWILMGDFNSEPNRYPVNQMTLYPDRVNLIQFAGTNRTAQYCNLIYPSSPTQGPKGTRVRTLDFAFASESLAKSLFPTLFNDKIMLTDGTVLSDHNFITLQLDI